MPSVVGKMVRNAVFNHLIDIGGLGTNAPTAKTIATDRLVLDQDVGEYVVSAETSTADDIDGISGFNEGQFLILRAALTHTITLKDENAGAAADTDKIRTIGGADMPFGDDEAVLLYHDDTLDRWVVLSGPVPASVFDHDAATNFVANEHIDHTSVTLTAGVGLSGGGDISANRTFTVDLNELTTETSIAAGDFIAMVDITDNGSGKITFANLEAAVSHANISGGGAHKISKQVVFTFHAEDLVQDEDFGFLPWRVPGSGEHGTLAAYTARATAGTAGTGTNTVKVQTSSTLGGARTDRATIALNTSQEAEDTGITSWTPANDEYVWVRATAVGGTAPKNVRVQIDLSESHY